jgi:Raf kinase inhibitor-like YbhB/YbcL family protein
VTQRNFYAIGFLILFLLLITGGEAMALEIKSTAFKNNEYIPPKYTCEGKDVSPPLGWTGAPGGTKSFALICDDPDAPMGTWVHWVVWDIPAGTSSLPEGVPKSDALDDGAQQGMTDFRRVGYGGPCPPPGKPHRYFFKLYALDVDKLNLKPKSSKKDLLAAMKGHILAQAELIGLFKR